MILNVTWIQRTYMYLLVLTFCSWELRVCAQTENLAFLSVSREDKIYKATLPNGRFSSIAFTKVIDTGGDPRQVSYDPIEQKIYWIEYIPDFIRRCDLDGSNPEQFQTKNAPWGLALDITNRVIYYSDYSDDGVSSLAMADFNGGTSTLISGTAAGPGENPRHIAYGPETMSLYVTYTTGTAEVASYDVDGTGKTTLFSVASGDTGFRKPNGIYVDEIAQELFFSDVDAYEIWFYSLQDRSTKVKIFDGPSKAGPRGISVYEDELYFCDYDQDSLYKIAKDGKPDPTMPELVTTTFDDGGALDGCGDIHFYIEPVGCVSNLQVTTKSSSELDITWDAPTRACQADFFQITYEAIDADQCNAEVDEPNVMTLEYQTENSATLSDLKAYTTYKITVTGAVMDLIDDGVLNAGAPAETFQDTAENIPSQGPGEIFLHSKTDTSASLSWNDIPCGSRGGDIHSYTYQLVSNDQVLLTGTTANQFLTLNYDETLNNLPCGSVTFGVTGTNAAGTGVVYSNNSYIVVSSEPFQPNTGLTISDVTATTAVISWSPSECQPSNYTVSYTLINLEQCQSTHTELLLGTVSTASVTLTGLAPGSSYEVTVFAMTLVGDSRRLTDMLVTAESTPKEPPVNVVRTCATGSTASFSWDEIPCGSRGGLILYYSYKAIVDEKEIISGQTTNRAVTLENFPCGVVSFQVAGATDIGVGASYGDVEIQVASTDPFQPGTALEVTGLTTTSVQILWTSSECPPSPFKVTSTLTNLEQCRESNSETFYDEITESSATLDGLIPGSTYVVTVGAQTTMGNTFVLETEFVTLVTVPLEAPTNLRLTSSDASSLTFSWDEVPCGSRGGNITYLAELHISSSGPISSGPIISSQQTTTTDVTITGLLPATIYYFRVAAINSAGRKYSDFLHTAATAASTSTKIYSMQLTISEIYNEPAVCLPQYADPSSPEFLEVASRFAQQTSIIFGELNGYQSVRVTSIQCGSLILDFDVVFDDASDTNIIDVSNAIKAAAGSDGHIGDQIHVSVNVQELCPSNYCPDGATCIADVTNDVSICRCPSSIVAANCFENNTNATDILIPVFTAIAALIVILFVITICMFFRRYVKSRIKSTNSPRVAEASNTLVEASTRWQLSGIASPWGFYQRQIWNPRFVGISRP